MEEKRESEYVELMTMVNDAVKLLQEISFKLRVLKLNEEFPPKDESEK